MGKTKVTESTTIYPFFPRTPWDIIQKVPDFFGMKKLRDASAFKKYAMPLIRSTYPTLLINDLVGVQPLQGPAGRTFSLKFSWPQTPWDKIFEALLRKGIADGSNNSKSSSISVFRGISKNLLAQDPVGYDSEGT